MMEKYSGCPSNKLTDAMKLLAVTIMKPEIAVDALGVKSYKELVDLILKELAYGRVPGILVEVEMEMRQAHHSNNIDTYAANIPL